MTTIAYRHGVMAADSAIFMGDRRVGEAQKMTRIRSGILGVSGSSDCRALYNLLRDDNFPKAEHIGAMKSDFSAILAHADKTLVYFTCDWINDQWIGQAVVFPDACETGFAIGSGAPYAIGAMFAGASASDAVAAACRHDPWSGGLISTLKLEDA